MCACAEGEEENLGLRSLRAARKVIYARKVFGIPISPSALKSKRLQTSNGGLGTIFRTAVQGMSSLGF